MKRRIKIKKRNPFKPWMNSKQVWKIAKTQKAQRWAGFKI